MAVVSAQCLGRGAEPLLPIKDALAAYLGRTPERIRRTLLGAAPSLLDSIPFIGRADFDGAWEQARAALDTDNVERVDILTKLADIKLYLGELDNARQFGWQELDEAERIGSIPHRASCLGILGAAAFFGGDVEQGESHFSRAFGLILGMPDEERDITRQTVLLGNLGNVAEARNDWTEGERLHAQALRLRRETADARGALHSLHALGRCRIGLGNEAAGLALLREAEQLAADLGETLERAKIGHTRAELALRGGDCATALQLAGSAHDSFARSRTNYDITHTLVTLSEAARACGQERTAVLRGAAARAAVEAYGYGLLRRAYPAVVYSLSDRIVAALVAYACGDALGLPFGRHRADDAGGHASRGTRWGRRRPGVSDRAGRAGCHDQGTGPVDNGRGRALPQHWRCPHHWWHDERRRPARAPHRLGHLAGGCCPAPAACP